MILIEQWRKEYNRVHPHSSLGYRPPAPEATILPTLTFEVVSFTGARHGYCQPGAIDILLMTRAMRVKMPHCELKWGMSVNKWYNTPKEG